MAKRISKLLASQILIPSPRGNHGRTDEQARANDCVFFHGDSSTARRPSRSASSFCPRAASIKPGAHKAPASLRTSANGLLLLRARGGKGSPGLVSSFSIRAITPFKKLRVNCTVSSPKALSPVADIALATAFGSRSASAQISQPRSMLGTAVGFVLRIESII